MAYVTDHLYSKNSFPSTAGWAELFQSWFSARVDKHQRKQDIKRLLALSDRLLEDIGLARPDLVEELGYDPRELPGAYRLATYHPAIL